MVDLRDLHSLEVNELFKIIFVEKIVCLLYIHVHEFALLQVMFARFKVHISM